MNLNFANTLAFQGALPALLEKGEAIITRAILPIPASFEQNEKNLALSQYRHEDFQSLSNDVMSFFAYPVMDSFGPDAKVAGVIASNVFWRFIFSRVLPESAGSFVCVLENSLNQTLSYRLDGTRVEYLGEGDLHDRDYDHLAAFTDMNESKRRLENPVSRSYTSAPINTEDYLYRLTIYPTSETEDMFTTNKPWVYTSIVTAVSLFTSILFGFFVFFV